MSRDGIEEKGRYNLYGFIFNDAIDWTDILGQKISPEVCSAWAEKKVKPWLKGKQELGDAVYDALLDRYFEEAIVTSITIINPGGMVNRKELGRTAVSEGELGAHLHWTLFYLKTCEVRKLWYLRFIAFSITFG